MLNGQDQEYPPSPLRTKAITFLYFLKLEILPKSSFEDMVSPKHFLILRLGDIAIHM